MRYELIESTLALLGLEAQRDMVCDPSLGAARLSGGQLRRVTIGIEMVTEPRVLLLDEPFNGLDIESRCHLSDSLFDLSKSGHLIIASHHQLESVTEIFTHALVLDQKQIAFGPAPEVMASDVVKHTLHSCHPHHHDRTL